MENYVTLEDYQELKNQHEKLIQKNELTEKVMRILIHDIRRPIANIVGFSSLLVDDENLSEEETRDMVSTIEKSSLQALKFLESYLILLKLEEGKAELNKEIIKISKFEEYIEETFASIKKGGCKLVFTKYFHDSSKEVLVEKNLLSSVFANLIKNATEVATNSDKEVRIYLSEDGNNFYANISNSGEIPEEGRKKLFQKFHTTKGGGTGLGLYSAKLLTEANGGELIYEPSIGTTTFTVKIPLCI